MFMKRDYKYGLPYYKYVGDTTDAELSAIFTWQAIDTIFSGIYTSRKYTNSQGQSVVAYENVGFAKSEVAADFKTEFENCQWMTPFYFDSEDGNTAALNRLKALVKSVLDENIYKYVKMTETLGFVYDPIKSYFESGRKDGGTTYNGSEAMGRVYNSLNRITSMEVDGPVNSYTFDGETATMQISTNKVVDVKYAGAESNELGKKATGLTGLSPAVDNGVEHRTTQFTTSYDDDTDGRKQAYQTTNGTTAVVDWHNTQTDVPAYGKVQVGNPGAVDYTDTKSFTGRSNTTGEMWSKEGSSVPAQDLIDKQRQIAKFSVEKEFFNDLKKKMLIAGWD